MQDYKTIRSVEEIDAYIGNATIVAFDFETAATDEYRDEDMSALDAHKADIAGISVSLRQVPHDTSRSDIASARMQMWKRSWPTCVPDCSTAAGS